MNQTKMERMKVSASASASAMVVVVLLGFVVLLSFVGQLSSALSITVNDVECVYEFVFFAGDTVSGNFVVVDHHVFWNSEHPGIDLIVTSPGGNVVHSSKGTSGDKFEFESPSSGLYEFCFHNSHSAIETVSFYIHVGHIPSEHDLAKDGLTFDPINVKIAELREALESVKAEQKYLLARDTRHRHSKLFFLLKILTGAYELMRGMYPMKHGYSKISAVRIPGTYRVRVCVPVRRYAYRVQQKRVWYIWFIWVRRGYAIANESTRKRVTFYSIGEYILLALASALQVVYIRKMFSKSVAYNRV
ncbi:hypothetical protein HYC85_012967 [Camellia sinensis]|uniref:GOLD domain-containing protein n=1 Tax=Camellia sinensis TaxID=4442 RepID=A0A7J7HG69_CAMSI|nr:hypothetical protein HYC85_012967 [Camellia sinensis]